MSDPPEGGRSLSPEAIAEALSAIERDLAAGAGFGAVRDLLAGLVGDCRGLVAAEQERRRRAVALEKLLPTLAEALDIRTVFRQVSTVAREIIPHDLLELGILDEDRTYAKVYAASEGNPEDSPRFRLPEEMRSTLDADLFLIDEITSDPATGRLSARLVTGEGQAPRRVEFELPPERLQLQRGMGIRCALRVPVRLKEKMIGALLFFSRQPSRYTVEHVDIALRIADQIALTLAHERLADEQKRAALLESRVEALTTELESKGLHRPVGVSKKWKDTLALATKVAGTETTVLLTGASGTGKEVVARFLHRASPRAEGPFVALNCAALPEQLLESELFGFEKGAFTGATASRPGRIEQAAGGVLFLDEVGEMSLPVQAKLLRVLQEKEFQRLGGMRPLKADVRIVAATNRDLAAAIAHGTFREDLYYRLSVFEIPLPPLRERPEDIPPLLEAFLDEIGRGVGRPAAGISREARDKLLAYPWPGNVRELRNAVERAVILCEGGLITGEHLPMSIGRTLAPSAPQAPTALPPGGVDLEAMEKGYVEQALQQAGNNKSKAARLLGLTRAQLYSRLEKYGL